MIFNSRHEEATMRHAKLMLRILVLLVPFLFAAEPTNAVTCCCSLQGPCQGPVCIFCDNCTGCIAYCGPCDSYTECYGCIISQKSGSFENVTIADAVEFLTVGTPLKVRIFGDPLKPVTLKFQKKSVLAILDEIARLTGVSVLLEPLDRSQNSSLTCQRQRSGPTPKSVGARATPRSLATITGRKRLARA
jgi:hypothetical protein